MLLQREASDLGVMRTSWRQLALVQKKLVGRHGTKVRSGQSRQFLLQALEVFVWSVFLAIAGGARASSATRQRQVRSERMVFLGNPESECGVVDGFGERWKFRSGFNSKPKDAGSFCSGEEAVAAK